MIFVDLFVHSLYNDMDFHNPLGESWSINQHRWLSQWTWTTEVSSPRFIGNMGDISQGILRLGIRRARRASLWSSKTPQYRGPNLWLLDQISKNHLNSMSASSTILVTCDILWLYHATRGTRSRPHPRDQADQGEEGSQHRAPRLVRAGAETLEGCRKETLVPAESPVRQGNLAQIFGVFRFFKCFHRRVVFVMRGLRWVVASKF